MTNLHRLRENMMTTSILLGIFIPFIGTALGAACVFLLKQRPGMLVQKGLLGFASGVMTAASVWSLLLPSMEMAEKTVGKTAAFCVSAGFLAGIAFLLCLEHWIPHLNVGAWRSKGTSEKYKGITMLMLAVTIHNIPEGMAVGAVFAAMANESAEITLMGAFALSAGIAIQNFPEGAIISMPLKSETGMNRGKAFFLGTLSGAVEPLAAVGMFLITDILEPVLPYFLSFAAGAMIDVVVGELIPQMAEGQHSNSGMIGFAAGFVLMMIMEL